MTSPRTTSAPFAAETSGTTSKDLGLLILRIGLAIVLIAHGAQKIFEVSVPGVGAWFSQLGVPAPEAAGLLVSIVEFLGGFAILLGVGARVSSVLVAVSMVGAIVLVHIEAGFFAEAGGFELPLLIAIAAVALAVAGPGRLSLARLVVPQRLGLLA